jgi:dTDP-4-amino-4,6-dideoxygalactose transaminase
MIDKKTRQAILKQPRPDPPFVSEPLLGSWYTEAEMEALNRVVRESNNWRGDGFGFISKETTDFEAALARYFGVEHVISITSAGIGLDMAAMCLDLKPGDEVVVPAINFRAAAHAVIGQGGKVVWCDVDPRTFCADPADFARRITPRTRALIVTHMNGLSADMDALLAVAAKHPGVKVIGDGARAVGGGYKGTKIGKRGWMNIFSFHTQKLMTTLGEGGAVVTDDPEVAKRLRQLRQWGHGERWGSNFKMTKVQAAVGIVQIGRLDEMLAPRAALAKERDGLLAGVPELTLPLEPEGYQHTYYLYTLLVPKSWAGAKRDRLMQIIGQDYGVGCVIANPPCYLNDPFLASQTPGQRLPLSEELGARLFCISIHPLMTREQNEYICAAVIEAVDRVKAE